ncbi:MAG: PepSY-associated TM helix domain-containing protein [Polaromonas sp.]|uniref:PepSY-associated TM helix domain-containing protein n=1 Tax=Polaromonas sp. TaxID=1869339 RepID=UPI00273270E7|nr:PepSY-associated TM helix domain-containing protein [Polaromonas sp.]MDP3796228.1 PepSY-associated TM helix domain-containing protein [Polaromonas sp.]
METTLRKSMAWLHTWAGVVIGSLLFAIFWMGTLSVFDREIDRWMMPATRLAPAVAEQPVKLDGVITEQAQLLAQGAPQWFIRLPSERVPAVELRWRNARGDNERRYLHPQTGALLEHTQTLAGTGFIFPFHYSLHLKWMDVGYWLVGLAGMTMLVMLVSGVIIHRRIFADFFLFRPQKQLQRASLDLHNLTGVLAMPFHFVIALSGLIIFMGIYWPGTVVGAYAGEKNMAQAFSSEAYGQYRRAKANAPGQPLASLDAMRASAGAQWQGGQANFIRVWHPFDANSYVELRRSHADTVTMNLDQLYFDAATGTVLKRFEAAPVMTVQRFISGLHFIQFEHWLLRWLYFLAGLAGCVLIATGFLFWLESRRASHAKKGLAGVRLVEALTVFSVPGLIIATLVFFISNRLLPLDAGLMGYGRAALEMWAFYLTWLATLAHAALRARAAWHEQAWGLAALAMLAVALNWASTGQHLAHTLGQGLWAVAGMDLALLATAGLAALAARHLTRKAVHTQCSLAASRQAALSANHNTSRA